jgi:hypothetical protein
VVAGSAPGGGGFLGASNACRISSTAEETLGWSEGEAVGSPFASHLIELAAEGGQLRRFEANPLLSDEGERVVADGEEPVISMRLERQRRTC